jgi:S1-C subfamily serine protease
VTIVRDGKQETLHPVLAEQAATRNVSNRGDNGTGEGRFGMALAPLTPDTAAELGLKNAHGVVVEDVTPGSVASEAGVRRGDVIEQVNRKPVNSVSEVQDALRSDNGGRPALLLVNRQGNTLFLALGAARG